MGQTEQAKSQSEAMAARTSPQLSPELMHKDALHVLGENAAAVLHDLRGPLQAILAHTQLLERKTEPHKQDLERHFSSIRQGVDQISSLLEQFLRLSRFSAATVSQMDMAECVRELLPLLRSMTIMRHIELQIELAPALPIYLGDEQQLKQLIFNLVANACDACESREEGALVQLSLCREGQQLILAVRDNGCGMSPDKLEKIWHPFYTSKATGTGLGLPSCLRIATEHGGTLVAESSPGQGSCFTLRLPLP